MNAETWVVTGMIWIFSSEMDLHKRAVDTAIVFGVLLGLDIGRYLARKAKELD